MYDEKRVEPHYARKVLEMEDGDEIDVSLYSVFLSLQDLYVGGNLEVSAMLMGIMTPKD
jgi:hypothetical protein